MIKLVGDYIITPLGEGVEENIKALLDGKTALSLHNEVRGVELVNPFVGSIFEQLPKYDSYSDFESLCIECLKKVEEKEIYQNEQTIFILSTTKGNIWDSLYDSAAKIATYFGNKNRPIVVSTACTSGASAQVVAYRLLTSGHYKSAVIVGCDIQCEFIVSGFQSFNALSNNLCRPFDAARDGLNAGEAVAAMILTNADSADGGWLLVGGSIHNDATHISAPSRTAEGSLRCLEDMQAISPSSEWACVSVHGTGTIYNDEMEAVALHRASCDMPISALKGFYGHTMGAAGLLETILTIHALDKGVILPAKGYENQGTTNAVNISTSPRQTDKRTFVKLLSGFGGVNAAAIWTKNIGSTECAKNAKKGSFDTIAQVKLENEDIVALYREHVGSYPKFFKMDILSKVGLVAVEMLKKQLTEPLDDEKTALIIGTHNGCIANDKEYQQTIADKENYFPSPALFVYTLPNIVTGEIAIRNGLKGESACYVLSDEEQFNSLVDITLAYGGCKSAIVGWLDAPSKQQHICNIKYIKL